MSMSRSRALRAPLALTLGLGISTTLQAQAPELDFLNASDGGGSDQFATAMARDGDRLLVGAPFYDVNGTDEGAVYVLEFDGSSWNETAILTASDGNDFDYFGKHLAVNGDLVAVGVPDHDENGSRSGCAYVFRFDGSSWVEDQKILPSDGTANDVFGSAVAIEDDRLVVGAPGDDNAAPSGGSLYAFRDQGSFVGWLEDEKFHHSLISTSDSLGKRLLLKDGNLFVGIPDEDTDGLTNNGVVALFQHNGGWQEVDLIQPLDGGTGDQFGFSLALDGDTLLVGSPYDDLTTVDEGSATVFELQGGSWNESQKLVRNGAMQSDNFGYAVDVDGNRALVGAPLADLATANDGAGFAFRRRNGNWLEDQPLGSSVQSSVQAGWSVALRGSSGLVGSPFFDTISSNSGALARHVVGDFVLDIQPQQPAAGDTITIDTYNGTPRETLILALTEVNGTPTFIVLLNFVFSANHHFLLSTTTPSGLAGLSAGFQTFKVGAFGEIQPSNPVTVDFQ